MNNNETAGTEKNPQKIWQVTKEVVFPITQFVLAIAVAVLAIVSYDVMEKTTEMSNTANTYSLYETIQERRYALSSVISAIDEAKFNYEEQGRDFNNYYEIYRKKEIEAAYELVKMYEYACYQYSKGKIDRETFDYLFKDGSLERTLDAYGVHLDINSYPSIIRILEEWK